MIKFRDLTLREYVILLIVLMAIAIVETANADCNGDCLDPEAVIINQNQVDRSVNVDADATANAFVTQDIGVSTSMEFHAADNVTPDDITIRNTASGRAPSVYPSGNCYMGWSVGLGVPGFNAGGGKATLDPNCDARETARMFYQFGERDKAIRILCEQPAAKSLDVCVPEQDYHREIANLKAQNALLIEDNGRLSDQVRGYCKESADRSIAACVEK